MDHDINDNNERKRKHILTKIFTRKNSHKKNGIIVADKNSDIEAGKKTVVKDVKRLIEAWEKGQSDDQFNNELNRLYHVIVDGQMEEVVIEGCGKENLKRVLGMAREKRKREKRENERNISLSDKTKKKKEKKRKEIKDSNKEKERWLRWFRRVYGMNGKSSMSDKLYNAILTAAEDLDFDALRRSCKSDVQFHQNGLSDCYKIAKSNNFYKTTTNKRVRKNYSLQGSPYITRKDWGSLFRPARG